MYYNSKTIETTLCKALLGVRGRQPECRSEGVNGSADHSAANGVNDAGVVVGQAQRGGE